MIKKMGFLMLIIFLTSCSGEENLTVNTIPSNTSKLYNELTVEKFELDSSRESLIQIKGRPIKEVPLNGGTRDSLFKRYEYYDQSFLIMGSKIIGYGDSTKDAKTKSGVKISDTPDNIINSYKNHRVYKHLSNTYFIYDEEYFLLFETKSDKITNIELIPFPYFLLINDVTLDDYLADSTSVINGSTSILDMFDTLPNKKTYDSDINDDTVGVFSTGDNAVSPEEEIQRIAGTMSINLSDSTLRQLTPDYAPIVSDPDYIAFSHPSITFISKNNRIKIIQWSETASYDSSMTLEGIGIGSSFNQTMDTYKSYEHKLLYIKNLEQPKYMVILYNDNFLVFEFSKAMVNNIFVCDPYVIDEYVVKKDLLTTEPLKEEPFFN